MDQAKKKRKPGPPSGPKVSSLPAPSGWRGNKSQLPIVKFRKPMAPPTKVHPSRKKSMLEQMAEQTAIDWEDSSR